MRQLGFFRFMHCFEAMSGLNINLEKNELFQVGEVSKIDSLAWILGYKIGSLPSSYLRRSLGTNFKSKIVWDPMIERIALQLESWKATILPKGGSLTLLKLILAFIPNYYLSLFTNLASMATKIETNYR